MIIKLTDNLFEVMAIALTGGQSLKAIEDVFNAVKTSKVRKELFTERFSKVGRIHAYSQIAHESANFEKLQESTNYTPSRLLKVFPTRVRDLAHATELCKDKKALFDHLYGGRMGNAPDEGYRYRGRGYIALTGKANYQMASDITGIDFVSNPELLSDPKYAWVSTYAYLINDQRLVSAIQKPDVNRATRIINGGLNGYHDRCIRMERGIVIKDGQYEVTGNEIELGKDYFIDTLVQYYLAKTVDSKMSIDGKVGPATKRTFTKAFKKDKYSINIDELNHIVDELEKVYAS